LKGGYYSAHTQLCYRYPYWCTFETLNAVTVPAQLQQKTKYISQY